MKRGGPVAVALAAGLLLTFVIPARAGGSNPFVIRHHGAKKVRVQYAEGVTTPCDASSNRGLVERWIEPGEEIRGSTSSDCLCIRQTSANFPSSGWSTPGLACVPRRCTRSACKPIGDATIRVALQ